MNYSCDVVRDLLPLYKDEICSEDSKKVVEEHIMECEKCQKYFEILSSDVAIGKPKGEMEASLVKKCFGKIKQRFAFYTVIISVSFPILIVILFLGINESRRDGICFSNMDDYFRSKSFMKQMVDGDCEKAFQMLDMKGDYNSIVSAKEIDENDPSTRPSEIERKKFVYDTYKNELEMTYEEYVEDRSKKYAQNYMEFEQLGIYPVSYKYVESFYSLDIGWFTVFKVTFQLQDGTYEDHLWNVLAGKDGIQYSGPEPSYK